MNINTVLLILFWLSFFAFHSLLAALPVKARLMRWMGLTARGYRLLYVILSSLHLLAIFIFSATIRSKYIFLPGGFSKFVALTLASLGIVICRHAFKSYDGKAFLGLSDLSEEENFRADGLLQYVRHPLYAGSIVLIIGFFLYIPNVANLISTSLMILYFIVGIYFEEQKLLTVFGEDYRKYKMKTPMLFPRLGRARKIRNY